MATEYLDKTGLQKLVSLIKSRITPVDKGGTGLTASPSMLVNLASANEADVLQALPRPGVTGVLPVANGGTGLADSPSMLVNLASTAAADVLQTEPRPGVTGTLPLARGGTGGTSASAARTNLQLQLSALYNSSPWFVYTNGRFVWIFVYGAKTGGGAWDAVTCPHTLASPYRPAREIVVPCASENGSSWTGVIIVKTNGQIQVGNWGANGSTDNRAGVVVFPMDY